jgi:hypothetical protein
MRRALTLAAIAAALAFAARAGAQDRTHVKDVRVGSHPGFDRVVVELDGNAEIAWERGPAANEESFYLDADLGRRERVVATKLANVGKVSLTAMRVGTHLSLEPRERRVRAYLLAKPTRLVIDVAPPGAEEFAVPNGVTPLAPATSIGSLKNAPIPEPQPKAEPEPAPEAEAGPEPEAPLAPESKRAAAPVTREPSPEPVEGAVEAQPEAPPPEEPAPAESAAPEAAAGAEPGAAPAENEVTLPETPVTPAETPVTAPEVATAPEPVPAPAPVPAPLPEPETGFPWLLALGALAVTGAVGGIAFVVLRRSEQAPLLVRPPSARPTPAAARPTPFGVDGISREEVRLAADATGALEQRLDQEARARVALEERLSEASEELKVLRDRLSRVERKRDEAL